MTPALDLFPGESEQTEFARQVLRTEAQAILALLPRVGEGFLAAVQALAATEGKVVTSGVGKSGHVAKKLAATLSSTGTPAFFLHPGEASHGDLGAVQEKDFVILISNSGESEELLLLLPLLRQRQVGTLAITGNPQGRLAKGTDLQLDASVEKEACPLGLAPTASVVAALALADALALSLSLRKGFSQEDFARHHPAGRLGKRLVLRVEDVMHAGQAAPRVLLGTPIAEALFEMSQKGLGMTAVVDRQSKVLGVFTDGDLRRALDKRLHVHETLIEEAMTPHPVCISPNALAASALALMEEKRINGLLVADETGKLLGALNMHDLLRAGVV